MTPRELALRLAALTVIADRVEVEREATRAAIVDALDALGGDSVRAELPDGTRIGKVSITAPKPSARVLDEDALAGWVAETHPTEVVWRVREAYRKVILDRAIAGPDGEAVDPSTGEIIPGIRFSERGRYPSMRFESDGRATVEAAFAAGVIPLDLTSTPALES